MKAWVCAAVFVAVWSTAMPSAAADPPQFPDLSNYTEVNAHDYTTYLAYMTAGVQFATPGGYRCRMSFTHKAAYESMSCWGTLPGTSHNHVGLSRTAADPSGATFSDVDLASMEKYQWMDADGMHDGTISPDAYKLLPTNSKVTYTDGPQQTCAVNGPMTACVVVDSTDQRHGFVLSPDGSWTF